MGTVPPFYFRIFSAERLVEKLSGKKFSLVNHRIEFRYKGIDYRLETWVETKLTSIWDNHECVEFQTTWLPQWMRWVCVKWILNNHPNRRK